MGSLLDGRLRNATSFMVGVGGAAMMVLVLLCCEDPVSIGCGWKFCCCFCSPNVWKACCGCCWVWNEKFEEDDDGCCSSGCWILFGVDVVCCPVCCCAASVNFNSCCCIVCSRLSCDGGDLNGICSRDNGGGGFGFRTAELFAL